MKQNEESDIDKNEYCINFLKSKKIKVTPQRIAICHYLLFTQDHPTAEDILNNAVKLCPTVSIATVYKTLKVFKEKKIVRELELNGITRYDPVVNPHIHIVCKKEKESIIKDYNSPLLERFLKDLSKELGFEIKEGDISIFINSNEC